MDLLSPQKLKYSQSQIYDILTDYASPGCEDIRESRESVADITSNNFINMDLLSPQKLKYSQSQIYDILTDYASPGCEDIRESRESVADITSNNFSKRRNKTVYSSPMWFRDSTKRLQRKPIRKSTSFESGINKIGGPELSMIDDEDNTVFSSTQFNTPGWQRIQYECTRQLRKDLMPTQNRNIFNSTMVNSYPLKIRSDINSSPDPLFETVEKTTRVNTRRNHTGKFKISDSWIDWTPFWSRDNNSNRLDRRHYISDFFEI